MPGSTEGSSVAYMFVWGLELVFVWGLVCIYIISFFVFLKEDWARFSPLTLYYQEFFIYPARTVVHVQTFYHKEVIVNFLCTLNYILDIEYNPNQESVILYKYQMFCAEIIEKTKRNRINIVYGERVAC